MAVRHGSRDRVHFFLSFMLISSRHICIRSISIIFPYHRKHCHTMALDKNMEIGFSNLQYYQNISTLRKRLNFSRVAITQHFPNEVKCWSPLLRREFRRLIGMPDTLQKLSATHRHFSCSLKIDKRMDQFHNHAQQSKVKYSGGPLDNQTWQTEWKTAPLAKVQLCEYEN